MPNGSGSVNNNNSNRNGDTSRNDDGGGGGGGGGGGDDGVDLSKLKSAMAAASALQIGTAVGVLGVTSLNDAIKKVAAGIGQL